uniref:Uncharacterized protein n=1 Tax=Acetithermum autotrophicum TaxID=1446466 RepID=H5SSN6_ACEAU|nr:hypothetical protein HGMM_OP3C327 [Candidatus Acetothermum autotrophicum]
MAMNQCTDQLHALTRAAPEVPTTASAPATLRFLDMMLGGFESEELEFTVTIPADWRDAEIQAFVFCNDAGRWVELEGRAERQGDRLKLTLPGGRLVHVAVALVPQYQMVP